jgi:hypothetical protein
VTRKCRFYEAKVRYTILFHKEMKQKAQLKQGTNTQAPLQGKEETIYLKMTYDHVTVAEHACQSDAMMVSVIA